ncbi:MAG: hypothetical protein CSA72_14130 [Rhodobacterales bacterium]|nr:MAG: hypothetical protein CR993_02715 [Rhodobacterales bacterium]PIE09183.1 MAG: hypothetical protein CSA72_14130 [Rhodobacterales bacterium]
MKIVLILIAILAALAYPRVKPLPTNRIGARPGPMEPGVHPMPGGVKVVEAGQPPDAAARLVKIAADSPRTRILETGEVTTLVTRSRLWGFPDIAVIWQEEDRLHIHSHLTIGRSDFGVNAARVAGWLNALHADP